MDVHSFKYPFAFIKSEVVSPSSQDHVQSRNRFEQGRSPGSKEDFLQLVSESMEALGVHSGCPGRAHKGIPEKFRSRRSKHAALVAIDSQLERPLYKRNHVLECPFCRLPRFGIAVTIVSKPTVLQSSLVQIFVEFVQDDQRQDRTQRRALRCAFLSHLNHALGHNARSQISADQPQKHIVFDVLPQFRHQSIVVDRIEELGQVQFHNLRSPFGDVFLGLLDGLESTLSRAESITELRKQRIRVL